MEKHLHTSKGLAWIMVLSFALLTGCSGNLTYQAAMDKNRKSISDLSRLQDANFLTEAASFNLFKKQVADLGVERGYSSALVDLARAKVKEYNASGREITKLAKKKKFKIPAEMKREHQALVDQLSSSAKAEFDSEFIKVLQDLNREQTAIYEENSSGAEDADVRAFAARNLGALRRNADEFAKVDDQLMHLHR